MRINMRSLIKSLLACLLLLSFVSCIYVADDTRFSLKDGVIDDSKLRLQWAPAPDLPMSYHNAEEYARHLSLAGGEWRLPTRAELKSLYDESKPGSVDPKFNVSKIGFGRQMLMVRRVSRWPSLSDRAMTASTTLTSPMHVC